MLYLILADVVWSVAAFIFDFQKLLTIPPWALLFTAICPIYPLLIAITLYQIYKKRKVNQYLYAFAVIPSAVFGVLAIVYYPLMIKIHGFNFNDFGGIFWVLFYSAQGWYLLAKKHFSRVAAFVVLVFLVIKFSIDYFYKTFGYLSVDELSRSSLKMLVGLAIIMTVAIFIYNFFKSNENH